MGFDGRVTGRSISLCAMLRLTTARVECIAEGVWQLGSDCTASNCLFLGYWSCLHALLVCDNGLGGL